MGHIIYTTLERGKSMLRDRGIRRGVEVFVKSKVDHDSPSRKAIVINTYPHPSRWAVVKYENGDMEQLEEGQITTMFEKNRRIFYWYILNYNEINDIDY